MAVKMPVEILSMNTYKLLYGILEALDDHFVYNDSLKQDKQDEQTRDKIMLLIHDYIGKPQVKNDISNCVELCSCSDIDQTPVDDDGWFDEKWLADLACYDMYGPQCAMREVLMSHVPKPVRLNRMLAQNVSGFLENIGEPLEVFMCEAVKFRDEYNRIAPADLLNQWGDTWITKLVTLYENLWKEIYNDD